MWNYWGKQGGYLRKRRISLIYIPTRYHIVPIKNANVKVQYVNTKCIDTILPNKGSKFTVLIENQHSFL